MLQITDQTASIGGSSDNVGRASIYFMDLDSSDHPDVIIQRAQLIDKLTVGSAFFVATVNRELIAVLPVRQSQPYNTYWAIRGLLHLINGLTMQLALPSAFTDDQLNETQLAIDDHNLGNTAISDPDKPSVTVVDTEGLVWAYLLSDDAI